MSTNSLASRVNSAQFSSRRIFGETRTGTHPQRHATRRKELRSRLQIHPAGGNDLQMRHGPPHGLDVARSFRRENLDQIRAGIMGQLRLRRSVRAENDRALRRVGRLHDFRIA